MLNTRNNILTNKSSISQILKDIVYQGGEKILYNIDLGLKYICVIKISTRLFQYIVQYISAI